MATVYFNDLLQQSAGEFCKYKTYNAYFLSDKLRAVEGQ